MTRTITNPIASSALSSSIIRTELQTLENEVNQMKAVTATVSLSEGSDYVCNGAADDAQINAAITAVNAAGGGTILIKAGTYDITSKIIHKDGVHIIGEGFATILKMTDSFAADAQGYYFLMATSATESTPAYNYDISLENICLDGNKANQSSAAGSHNLIHAFGDYHYVLRNVEFKNGKGTGLDVDNGGAYIDSCIAHDNGLDGFYLNHTTPEGHRHPVIIGCQSYSNGRDGIFSPEYGVSILHNFVWSNTRHGIHVLGFTNESLDGTYKRIIGNYVRANTGFQIYLEGGDGTYMAEKNIVKHNVVNVTQSIADTALGNNSNDAGFETHYWRAQPFTTTYNYIYSLGAYLKKTGSPTGDMTYEIQSDNAGVPSGTVLATGTIDVSTLTTSYALKQIVANLAVTPGTTYHLCLKGQSAWTITDDVSWGYQSGTGFAQYNFGPGNFTNNATTVRQAMAVFARQAIVENAYGGNNIITENIVDYPIYAPGAGNIIADNIGDTTNTHSSLNETLTNKTLTSPKINEDVAVTSTATEINVLDGIPATLTATELGYVDGVTSSIQTQLDAKIAKTTLDADSVLTATSDNTPIATTLAEQTVLGRLTGGHPDDISIGIANDNILQVDDATVADNDYAKFTANGIEGVPYSTVLSDIGAEPSGAVATHAALTTGVHGVGAGTIAKTSDITATKLDDFATPDNNTDLNANTTNHGLLLQATAPSAGLTNVVAIENGETVYKNKALFDATSPSTQAFGDAASVGTAVVAARRDHKHAMPAAEKDTTAANGVLKGNGSVISACSNLSDVAYLPLAGGTLTGDVQLGETDIKLDAVLSGDETWSGIVIAGTAGATLAVGDVCYLGAAGKWLLNDGILDGTDTGFSKQLGICVLAGADTEPTEMLTYGKVRSAAFPAFTVGSPVYLDDTAGDLTVTEPSTANFAIRVVGFAITAEDLLFNPSPDYIVHV